jgi:hypothetical protein
VIQDRKLLFPLSIAEVITWEPLDGFVIIIQGSVNPDRKRQAKAKRNLCVHFFAWRMSTSYCEPEPFCPQLFPLEFILIHLILSMQDGLLSVMSRSWKVRKQGACSGSGTWKG